MVVWSSALRILGQNIVKYRCFVPKSTPNNALVARSMSDHGPRIFPLQPSKWQWNKTKDVFHFYVMLGLIPIGIIVTGTYIFVGPATLQEIPEGYTPKPWEYHRNPITRFIARYVYNPPQQEYEKMLHGIWEETEKMKMRELENRVMELMKNRNDYQAYYWRPGIAKYHRLSRSLATRDEEQQGE